MSYLSDFMGRLRSAPSNAQCGYRYTSVNFTELHVTSAVQTDEAAIAYIEQIENWFPTTKVMLLEKRDAGQQTWRLIHRAEEAAGQLYVLPDGPQGSGVPASERVSEPASQQSEANPLIAPPPSPVIIPPAVPRPADRP